jgi:eukaryotic-like serine/threonine-protein kinase
VDAEPGDLSERDERLGAIVFACLRDRDQGRPLDRQALLARHPEFTVELAEFFADQDYLLALAAPLQEVARHARSTGGSEEGPQGDLADEIPERLGEFAILRELGHGGMGVVYEAVQESVGRHVALKILPRGSLTDPTLRKRFRTEVRAAARLSHPNIVPVFGAGEAAGVPYYAMQFIVGRGLDHVVAELRRLHERSAASTQPGISPDRMTWSMA